MVRPMSSASQPISIASAASEIRSPADGPTIAQPISRPLSSSHSVLVRPSSRPSDSERPLAAQGNTALPYLRPLAFGLRLGDADPGDFGVGIGDRRNDLGVERRLVAARDFGRDLALVRRLVREHRLADDVADREDVGDVGAHLLVDAR